MFVKLNCGERNGSSLQYSCLENPRGGRAWWAAVHGVEKSQTRLSNFTFTFHFHALEKAMATHSCSCLENPVDRRAWWAAVHGVTQSQTRRSTLACIHALEKEMATHSSFLAWRIPGTEKPGGLLSMGSYRVGHD